jgi:hypothetical protein
MTLLARPPDVISRRPLPLMKATCADELPEIQRLWPRFEALVGLRGRRMYAVADLASGTYSTCCLLRPGDDPRDLGLDEGELPGGRFLRGRLVGEPPDVYDHIGPGFEELRSLAQMDRSRPLVEFYARRDEIELWLPVLDGASAPGPCPG